MLAAVGCGKGAGGGQGGSAGGLKTGGMGVYGDPRLGVQFRYPAGWKDKREEHVPVQFVGGNDCSVYVTAHDILDGSGMGANLESVRQMTAQEQPGATFGPRPAWAGPEKPDASYAMFSMGKHGVKLVEYDSGFQRGKTQFVVTETLREGDAGCAGDLQGVERTLRMTPPVVGN